MLRSTYKELLICRAWATCGGSSVDVVTLPDQFVESGEILMQIFAVTGNKARNNIQSS